MMFIAERLLTERNDVPFDFAQDEEGGLKAGKNIPESLINPVVNPRRNKKGLLIQAFTT